MRWWTLIAVTLAASVVVTRGEAPNPPLNPSNEREEGQLAALKDALEEVKEGGEGEKDKVEGRVLGLLGGGGGGYGDSISVSTKVYSSLAVIAFTAFVGYAIYFFISSDDDDNDRSGTLLSDPVTLQGILRGVEDAIRRFSMLQRTESTTIWKY